MIILHICFPKILIIEMHMNVLRLVFVISINIRYFAEWDDKVILAELRYNTFFFQSNIYI